MIEANYHTGRLSGEITESVKTLAELKNVFANESARAALDQSITAYSVQMHAVVPEGTPGGLFFGTSFVQPGVIDGEYFMTRGHFHAQRDRAEYYWCYAGQGVLLLMDGARRWSLEVLKPGSVHYIAGHVAHRLVNTGRDVLAVGACWPSDAGHDYATISEQGFSVRVVQGPNGPEFRDQP
ncbi:MAG: glucose-6-phosphate isomerase family protein [Spirochaetales bacterium]